MVPSKGISRRPVSTQFFKARNPLFQRWQRTGRNPPDGECWHLWWHKPAGAALHKGTTRGIIDLKSKIRRCFPNRHIGNLARIIIQVYASIIASLVLHPPDKTRICLGQRIDLFERRQ